MLSFYPLPLMKPVVSPLSPSLGSIHFEKKLGHSVISHVLPKSGSDVPAQPDGTSMGKTSAWTSVRQERWSGELVVEGTIPLWLNGTYLRNGAGLWDIDQHHFVHLFDGYATLVRVSFNNGRVSAGHCQVESDAYKAARKNRHPCYNEFSGSPKAKNFLSYVGELLSLLSGSSITDNANVSVAQLGDGRVLCLTETTKGSIQIDPNTLDTIGRFQYSDNLGAIMHSAHPIITELEFLNLSPDLVRPGYVVARMEPGGNNRIVVGRVNCRGGHAPGWVHSFPVTEHYIVVPEMPLRYHVRNLLRAEPAPLYLFEWQPESGSYMHVMCKTSGKIVASVEVPPFFTFHFINAYEEKDEEGHVTAIIADCCEYNGDASILQLLELDKLRSFTGLDVLPDSRVGRFRIPLDGFLKGELSAVLDPEEHGRGIDLCSINPAYRGKKYQYAYACGAHRPCYFLNTLTKIDLVTKSANNWHEDGAVPSEPLFVARPGATKEDDGVVISIVSAKNGGGYALLLDAASFKEIARAQFPYGLPYGFHGCWIPRK